MAEAARASTGSGRIGSETAPAEAEAGSRPGSLGSSLTGAAAVDLVEERLLSLRIPTCRFGEPAVYVGTIAGAVGLEFQAVRILGLAEGSLPSPGREDPVLPDAMRREVDPLLVPLAEDRALGQLHAFDRAVRGARRAIALSVPRSDLERSEREASSLLIDVGEAIGGPDPEDGGVVPGLASLARTSFGPARAAAASFREAHPLSAPQWLERAARTSELHPAWARDHHLDLARIRSLSNRTGLGPADGVLGDRGQFPPMPGLDPGRPISASALEKLLSCPLGFLFERILHFKDPGGAPSVRELDALSYGGLFHEVVEVFYRAHGEEFVARKKTLSQWKALARELANVSLASLLTSYPLVGAAIREKERKRLLRDLESFLEYDWKLPLSRFVGVELPFGSDEPVVLKVGGVSLHVRGYVDRLDVEGDHALLRDLKTGRDHPRIGDEAGPTPGRDVQLGLYGLVARKLAAKWGIPTEIQAAYVYPRNGEERAFRGDHARLDRADAGAGSSSPLASCPSIPSRRPRSRTTAPTARSGPSAATRRRRGRRPPGRRGRSHRGLPGAGAGGGMSARRTPPDQVHRDARHLGARRERARGRGRRHGEDHAPRPPAGGDGRAAGRRAGPAPVPARGGHLHEEGGRRAAAPRSRAAPRRALEAGEPAPARSALPGAGRVGHRVHRHDPRVRGSAPAHEAGRGEAQPVLRDRRGRRTRSAARPSSCSCRRRRPGGWRRSSRGRTATRRGRGRRRRRSAPRSRQRCGPRARSWSG